MDIEYKVVEKLIEKNFHITFAESCTAGLAAAKLVNVPDASKVLDVSFVTYANEAKQKYVNVNEDTIEAYGVVSEEVAGEMAAGAANAMGAEVGVGISGIAGPTGGTDKKPVGMVCFGFYVNGNISTYTMKFGDIGRNNVRAASVDFCYEKLLELI
jgi:nicotinamide-nucleotide amidase